MQRMSLAWTDTNILKQLMRSPQLPAYYKQIGDVLAQEKERRQQMRFPAPAFVVEVLSPSTEAIDRDTKFVDYAGHGVTEYWLVDPETETVEQYLLREGRYELALKLRTGPIEAVAIPGLQIPVRAIFDPSENMAALRQIVAG